MFSTHSWECADVWLLPRTLRNYLLVYLHTGVDQLGALAGQLLARLKLKVLVRRLLRRQL